MKEQIVIKGVRQNNLKNFDLTLPRNKLIVFTGISGSGKSSLAFDTIYAEGQRRYVESLSSYARQFLGQMGKPDVDSIDGLSPAVSIDQKTTSRNPRSTVGTVTEIHDYLRLLYANIGVPHCPQCGKEIRQQTIDQMVDRLMQLPEGSRIVIYSPIIRQKKGLHMKVFEELLKEGYIRVRVNGTVYETTDPPTLEKNKKHTIDVMIDRVIIKPMARKRLADSVETAARKSNGLVLVDTGDPKEELLFSENHACPDCGISIPEITPRMFSFNSPFGACRTCNGIGYIQRITPDAVVPDKTKSINQGAIVASGWAAGSDDDSIAHTFFTALADRYHFSLDTPFGELSDEAQNAILFGTGKEKLEIVIRKQDRESRFMTTFEGIIPNQERKYKETTSDVMRMQYEAMMTNLPCPSCHGDRLIPEALAVTVGGKSIAEICNLSVLEMYDFFIKLKLTERDRIISQHILKEICARLRFLSDVGLDYLSVGRSAVTLSGGEAQRIRLATQIGSNLIGVMYVLDEPSIGLHQRDNAKLLKTLKELRDIGNTLIVVEHDEETIRAADQIVDIGPGAGEAGGNLVAQGTVDDIMACPTSVTGQYLSGKKQVPIPQQRRIPSGSLRIIGASENNLKDLTVEIPLGVFVCVTGVSGSGKSSLVNEILYKSLAAKLNHANTKPGKYTSITGTEYLDKIINIDQSPIGRTPRSNPATYTGVFDLIRKMFASTVDAKARGYKENRFSFNVKGGRCEACSGDGIVRIEMHFLPDVYVPCEICKGQRYNRETLEIRYKGKNIADVLQMTANEALSFFENIPSIRKKIQTLCDVGLGYIHLGQPSTTLSGGEAQRIKLATELSRPHTGRTLYVLDEPTTGLHAADVDRLIQILNRLVEAGNSVIVIEHNMDVIKTADRILDLGPEGGDAGGYIVAQGTPEDIIEEPASYTGIYLKAFLEQQKEKLINDR